MNQQKPLRTHNLEEDAKKYGRPFLESKKKDVEGCITSARSEEYKEGYRQQLEYVLKLMEQYPQRITTGHEWCEG